MKFLMTTFALCLLLSPAERAASVIAVKSESAFDFCEVMATPAKYERKQIKLQTEALALYGGVLLKSDKCKAQAVTLHYRHGYEQNSNASAIKALNKIERKIRAAALKGQGERAEQTVVNLLVEGTLEKNPYYHLKIARADRTMTAW
ncbi:MAG TPA: hypothetical protein VM095_13675, partial [Pyrinomonadaceae bacterium]|nr:hypothetical protein [Pyrinomonadaceae bacterium]